MRWNIVYADEVPNMTEGFAEDWGMHINRPFHLISVKSDNFLS
jgi:hypothetical protein